MSLLFDSRVLIWWLTASARLPQDVMARINSGEEIVAVSAASLFEIEFKRTAGKLACPNDLEDRIEAAGFRLLAVMPGHAVAAGRLPFHHADPFDRLLIAQAQCEHLTLLTADERLRAYSVDLLLI